MIKVVTTITIHKDVKIKSGLSIISKFNDLNKYRLGSGINFNSLGLKKAD